MKLLLVAAVLLPALCLSACGGSVVELSCDDEIRLYQRAERGRRIEAPDGLDNLDALEEIPLPSASPAPPRPPGSPCIDRPPSIGSSGS